MTPPKRQLGLLITAALVIANMIGTGVFTTTGFQAIALHDPMTILMTWIVGGLLALCGAAAYAELGSLYPREGGEYVYLSKAYHPAVGFMSGWVSMTAGFSAPIAAAALVFAAYVSTLWPALQQAHPWVNCSIAVGSTHLFDVVFGAKQALAMVLIAAVTAIHAFDTRFGGRVQATFTILKVLLIVGFIAAGLLAGTGDWSHFASQSGGLANMGTKSFALALMYVTFAYSGWNAAAYIASDVTKPERTLPRSLLIGTGTVMVLYVLLNVVFLYALPSETLAHGSGGGPILEVGERAATTLFGASGGRFVTIAIALALVSAVSAMVMAGPRVYAAMAADRALPKWLDYHSDRGVPTRAVYTQCGLGMVFVLCGDPDTLIRFVGFTLAISAALTVGGLFVFRRRGERAAYRTFGYPVTPLAFIALTAWIAYAEISARPKESAVIAAVVAAGGILYYFRDRGTAKPKPEPPPPLPEARVVSDDEA